MNSTSQDNRSVMPRHPYPMVRAGGLFLLIFGVGIIGDVFLNGVILVGAILAMASLMFSKVLSFGKPKRIQFIALALAIVLEIVLIVIMIRMLPANTLESVRSMCILLIVGIHFLPMAISFGPRFGILGILCIVNASAGLILSGVAVDIFLLLDGALKVVFGIWFLSDKARAV